MQGALEHQTYFYYIYDLKAYLEAELGNLVAPRLLTLTKIKALYELAKSSKSGDVPDNLVVNHCLAENPYESLYKDEWKKKISASKFLRHYFLHYRSCVAYS